MPRKKTLSDEVVLDRALEVVRRRGPEGFTLADVARECGLSPSTLVQRFASKEALLEGALERASQRLERELMQPSPPGGSTQGLVEWLAQLAFPFRTRELLAAHLLLLRRDLSDAGLRRQARRQSQLLRDNIARKLGERAPTLPLADRDALAGLIEAHWHGLILQWALAGRGTLRAWMQRGLDALLERVVAEHGG